MMYKRWGVGTVDNGIIRLVIFIGYHMWKINFKLLKVYYYSKDDTIYEKEIDLLDVPFFIGVVREEGKD